MNRPFALPGSSPFKAWERRRSEGYLPRGWIDGLTLSNDTTDATNDIAIAAGSARSTVRIVDGAASTLTRDQMDLDLPVGIIKQLDVAFAPENYDPDGYSGGGRSGCRSSSSLADASWHYFLVGGGGLQTDVLAHDSATQSSVLAEMQKIGGYTAYRPIGSVVRSTSIVPFTQVGDYFSLVTKVGANATNPGTSAVTRTLTVPTGIQVFARVAFGGSGGSSAFYVLFSDLAETDSVPSASLFNGGAPAVAGPAIGVDYIRTNTSGQVRSRISASGASDTLLWTTLGWIHSRGKDA